MTSSFEATRPAGTNVVGEPSGAEGLDEQLFQAVERGDVEAARGALEGGADARYVRVERGDCFRTETPVLYLACKRHDRALVELLLAHGADPDASWTDRDSWFERHTCLRAAMPSIELVTLLLDKGADPNLPSESGESCPSPTHALDDAKGNEELTALLRSRGAHRKKMQSAVERRERTLKERGGAG